MLWWVDTLASELLPTNFQKCSQVNLTRWVLLGMEDVFKKLHEMSHSLHGAENSAPDYKSKYWMGNSPSCSPLNIQQYCRLFETVFSKNDSELRKPLTTKQVMQCHFSMSQTREMLREVGFRVHSSYNHRMSDLEIMSENNQSILQVANLKSRKTAQG